MTDRERLPIFDESRVGKCLLCNEPVPMAELLEHVREMHPDDYGDGPERWPDGSLVLHDETNYTADEIGQHP